MAPLLKDTHAMERRIAARGHSFGRQIACKHNWGSRNLSVAAGNGRSNGVLDGW